jgi:hypothetical protein
VKDKSIRRPELDAAFERFTDAATAAGLDTTNWYLRRDTDRGKLWGVVKVTDTGGHGDAGGQLYYLSDTKPGLLRALNDYTDAWRMATRATA